MAEEKPTIPDELVVIPRKPIELGELKFSELVLREPTAGQMVECDNLTGHAYDVQIIASVSGWPIHAVNKLPARDMLKAARFIGAFLA